jgi:A/G-specific adenine glycosylase
MDQERTIREGLAAMEDSIRARSRSGGFTPGLARSFQKFLMLFYATYGRDLPWRRTTDPYRILVSEFMLQQTRVERVSTKYQEFLGRFPDVTALARAPRNEVLLAWQGLGYNRRALALHETARRVMDEFHGSIPLDRTILDSLPGIGKATAGAILVFSTNRPGIFIETNIRRVYIHLFFPDSAKVHDREIEPLLGKTLLKKRPREFYYALMDYGSALKKGFGDPSGSAIKKGSGDLNGSHLKKGKQNPNTRSASYSRQSPFEGSDRQVRGMVLRHLLAEGEVREEDLIGLVPVEPGRLERILGDLEREGFLERSGGRILC